MIKASQNRLKIAFAVLFLLRSLWVPAHVALEPHDHSLPGAALQSEAANQGHSHGDGGGFHVHDQVTPGQDEGRDERPPHPRHPATDHRLDPLAPQARTVLFPEPVAVVGTALVANLDLELRRDQSRATASAPGGRSPPPRPPSRAPPLR